MIGDVWWVQCSVCVCVCVCVCRVIKLCLTSSVLCQLCHVSVCCNIHSIEKLFHLMFTSLCVMVDT